MMLPHQFRSFILPVYTRNAGHVVWTAGALCKESVPDLPGEHRGILLLVLGNGLDHMRSGHLGLAATNHPGLEVASFVIS